MDELSDIEMTEADYEEAASGIKDSDDGPQGRHCKTRTTASRLPASEASRQSSCVSDTLGTLEPMPYIVVSTVTSQHALRLKASRWARDAL